MLKIGWLSTGRGPGSQGLLRFVQDRLIDGRLDARIEFVFSNREHGEAEGSDQFFSMVREYGLPLATFSSSEFRRSWSGPSPSRRKEYDRRVMSLLSGYSPDVCILAGYMLIVGGAMCRRYPLLNLHPALPDGPIGTWQEVIWSLIENKATHTGAMVHLATEDVDRGPVISHCTVPITGEGIDGKWRDLVGQNIDEVKVSPGEELPLFRMIREREYQREPYLLFETLRAVAQGRVNVQGGEVLNPEGQPLSRTMPHGLCLDEAIYRAMAGIDEPTAASG